MNRKWTHLLSASLMAFSVNAQAATLLVGGYTDNGSEGIYRYDFDARTGQIDATPRQVVKSVSPSWLVLSADRRQLFAVNETPKGQVSGFSLGKQGEIKLLTRTEELRRGTE